MDRRVETFLQAAECGSFSEVARKLYITQPAVTQQINSLADELGVRLFERDGNRMMLTTPGRVAQRHFLNMQQEEAEMMHELAPWTARHGFVIGCPSGMIEYDGEQYSKVLQAAMRCFPDADVTSLELVRPAAHFPALSNHEADVIISGIKPMLEAHGDAVDYRVLRRIRYYVVCHRDWYLARKEKLSLADLAGELIFQFDGEAFPDELIRALNELPDPKPALRRQQSLAGALPLIQAKRGITIYAQRIPLPDDVVLVPITDFEPDATVGLVWLKGPRTAPFRRFINEVVELYRGTEG